MSKYRVYFIVVMIVAVSSCAPFYTINDGGTAVSKFETDIMKRAVIVSNKKTDYKKVSDNTTITVNQVRVCAEPSPDAMSALAMSLGIGTKVGAAPVNLNFGMQETVAYIGIRTATIQLLRDSLYRACEAYMNGAIDELTYGLIVSRFDKTMVAMLAIDSLTQRHPAPQVTIGADVNSTLETGKETGSTSKISITGAKFGSVASDNSTAVAMVKVAEVVEHIYDTLYHDDDKTIDKLCLMWTFKAANKCLEDPTNQICKDLVNEDIKDKSVFGMVRGYCDKVFKMSIDKSTQGKSGGSAK
jgi:hypothetical protein